MMYEHGLIHIQPWILHLGVPALVITLGVIGVAIRQLWEAKKELSNYAASLHGDIMTVERELRRQMRSQKTLIKSLGYEPIFESSVSPEVIGFAKLSPSIKKRGKIPSNVPGA